MWEVRFQVGEEKLIGQVGHPGSGVCHLVLLTCEAAYGGVNMTLSHCKGKLLEHWAGHCGCANAAVFGPALGGRVVRISADVLERAILLENRNIFKRSAPISKSFMVMLPFGLSKETIRRR